MPKIEKAFVILLHRLLRLRRNTGLLVYILQYHNTQDKGIDIKVNRNNKYFVLRPNKKRNPNVSN